MNEERPSFTKKLSEGEQKIKTSDRICIMQMELRRHKTQNQSAFRKNHSGWGILPFKNYEDQGKNTNLSYASCTFRTQYTYRLLFLLSMDTSSQNHGASLLASTSSSSLSSSSSSCLSSSSSSLSSSSSSVTTSMAAPSAASSSSSQENIIFSNNQRTSSRRVR